MRLLSVLVVLLFSGCAVPIRATISPAALLSAVETAERERDGHAPALSRALSSHHKTLRIAALRALARIEEVGTSSKAIVLLGDRDPEVATWAAFALGQIGEAEGEAALRAALDDVSIVPDQVLLALGRIGTATTTRTVAKYLTDKNTEVRRAAVLAIGLLAKRHKLKNQELAKKVAPLVKDSEQTVRFAASYAAMRLPGPVSAIALISALADPDPETRINAVRGLGQSGAAPQVLDRVMSDSDWRVRVELARALGAIGSANDGDAPAAAARLSTMVPQEFARFKRGGVLSSGRATHVLLGIMSSAIRLGTFGKRVMNQLERTPWNLEQLPPEVSEDLSRLRCALAFVLDRRDNVIRRVKRCGDASMPAWRRAQLEARLWGLMSTEKSVTQLVELTREQDPRIRAAAVEALGEIERPTSVLALTRLLESNDLYVAAAAAEILARPKRAQFRPAGLAERLKKLLERMKQVDASLTVGVLDAIGSLGRSGRALLPDLIALADDPRAPIRRRAAIARAAITKKAVVFGGRSPPARRPGPKGGRTQLTLITERGKITMELFGDVAPYTVGTITKLAKEGFYKGKTFHRVVSDFVVQGGCPRGDGWGNPGYTIDDETSPLPFLRGAVGIATAGRDTGGSQLFIMHSYHPHLDGGYTLFGRVVGGIEVVDALHQDDRILDVQLKEMASGKDGRPADNKVR